MKNIVVLISGRGANFVALEEVARKENWKEQGLQIACVISNRPRAAGLAKAQAMGIDMAVVDHTLYENRMAFEDALVVYGSLPLVKG